MQCKVHFKIFCKKLSYDPFIILIMCNQYLRNQLQLYDLSLKGEEMQIIKNNNIIKNTNLCLKKLKII